MLKIDGFFFFLSVLIVVLCKAAYTVILSTQYGAAMRNKHVRTHTYTHTHTHLAYVKISHEVLLNNLLYRKSQSYSCTIIVNLVCKVRVPRAEILKHA